MAPTKIKTTATRGSKCHHGHEVDEDLRKNPQAYQFFDYGPRRENRRRHYHHKKQRCVCQYGRKSHDLESHAIDALR